MNNLKILNKNIIYNSILYSEKFIYNNINDNYIFNVYIYNNIEDYYKYIKIEKSKNILINITHNYNYFNLIFNILNLYKKKKNLYNIIFTNNNTIKKNIYNKNLTLHNQYNIFDNYLIVNDSDIFLYKYSSYIFENIFIIVDDINDIHKFNKLYINNKKIYISYMSNFVIENNIILNNYIKDINIDIYYCLNITNIYNLTCYYVYNNQICDNLFSTIEYNELINDDSSILYNNLNNKITLINKNYSLFKINYLNYKKKIKNIEIEKSNIKFKLLNNNNCKLCYKTLNNKFLIICCYCFLCEFCFKEFLNNKKCLFCNIFNIKDFIIISDLYKIIDPYTENIYIYYNINLKNKINFNIKCYNKIMNINYNDIKLFINDINNNNNNNNKIIYIHNNEEYIHYIKYLAFLFPLNKFYYCNIL